MALDPKQCKVSNAIKGILAKAYPCPHMTGACQNVRYSPDRGLMPRGFTGAFGSLEEIRLIILLAEPGEPVDGEKYDTSLSPRDLIDNIAWRVALAYERKKSTFHSNVRRVLDYCWPQLSLLDQLKRTWITESTLCSADVSAGPVPRLVTYTCASTYLAQQLALLPNAFTIALGGKASRRVELINRSASITAFAAGKPGCNLSGADPSWLAAGAAFQNFSATT